MEDHPYSLPIKTNDAKIEVQNVLSKNKVDLRPASDTHSDQNTSLDSSKPHPPLAIAESAAASMNDAPQSENSLRHDNKDQRDSAGGTRINPHKKPNGRVLYCDILDPDGTSWLPKLSRKQRQIKKQWYRAAVEAKKATNEMLAAAEVAENSEMRDAL
ncbi:hypothetical protein BPOR_0579g00090 [Botrytis porri]|uniref:Uncharacterized protein n=1 Tax=Botrytis porri TaxID=87229 RepID=A0A4Z1KDZ2_9HELO|nr:hypothetical protein BPOR_0579g00090 [Botrytis porri]